MFVLLICDNHIVRGNIYTFLFFFQLLDEKIRQKYSNLYKAFIDMDRDRDGFINMTDLREHMKRLGVNVSGVEFRKLWDMVDPNRRRKLSFLEFNDRFANLISPNFASMPLSRRPSTPPLKEWQEPRVEKAYIRKLRDIDVSRLHYSLHMPSHYLYASFSSDVLNPMMLLFLAGCFSILRRPQYWSIVAQ